MVFWAVCLGAGALVAGELTPLEYAEANAAEGASWAERLDASFAIGSDKSVIGANDLGMVNGWITFNGRIEDVARVAGAYAPPYFSEDFLLDVTFDGRRVRAGGYQWRPEVLTRTSEREGWRITSRLYPLAGRRGAILEVSASNACANARTLKVARSSSGGVGQTGHWGFQRPCGRHEKGLAASVGWTLGEGDAAELKDVPAGQTRTFHLGFALGEETAAKALVAEALADPRKAVAAAVADWRARVRRVAESVPEFRCSDARYERLYNRSLLHLLLCQWNTDAFCLRPYFATGGVNGGCICCYLWNLGGPFRLLPLVDPKALKEHLAVLYRLDLDRCYAFSPSNGAPLGPYYMINQEKMIFLIDAYVRETGDVGYLNETVAGGKVIERVVRYALDHDDLSKEAVLVNYGTSNSHLELRKSYHYSGVMPDLNLRRGALLHLAGRLCRMAGFDAKVDFDARAAALRKLVRAELWRPDLGWFKVRFADGREDVRWTMQMFKAFGWGETVLDRDVSSAMLRHLMNPKEFLGEYGVHSLSKQDPAYDDSDVDNGGPGACPSFPAAICERLFRDGHAAEANEILSRQLWLADRLPYWGDSQYADRPDYRRDTPLQSDIEGACLAQAIAFGMFGTTVGDDLSVRFDPHLPKGVDRIFLKNFRLAGKAYDVSLTRSGGPVVKER